MGEPRKCPTIAVTDLIFRTSYFSLLNSHRTIIIISGLTIFDLDKQHFDMSDKSKDRRAQPFEKDSLLCLCSATPKAQQVKGKRSLAAS